MFDHTDVIHRYTRADAIRDGVLIDVTAVAREAGLRYPVAIDGFFLVTLCDATQNYVLWGCHRV
jgi:hypothetical protein